MAPAGNFECLRSAIKAGCDSVYFGVDELNMRVKGAKNFSLSELKKVKEICKNVKCYLTLNSIIYDGELELLDKILEKVKQVGIDGVIASDQAVIQKCNKLGINVCVSTQKSISNIEAVRFYSKFCDRVVLARELSLEQIKKIKGLIVKEKIKGVSGRLMEIECFVHGAMCISVSGRCFLSLFEFGCSANRGECLQSCRREYLIKDVEENKELKIGSNYILSPKDLCCIKFLDKLDFIDVFKIEGRARAADYVYEVVKCYREGLDAISRNEFTDELKEELYDRLSKVYNRGFSDGFYFGKPLKEFSECYGSKATEVKEYVGKITNYFSKVKVAEIKVESSGFKVGDEICVIGKTTGYFKQSVLEIRDFNRKNVSEVKKGLFSFKVDERVREGDKVYLIKPKSI